MNREEFIKKYTDKTYLGDGLFVHFDGYHFILETKRENGVNWVGLEPPVFDAFIQYRKDVYEDANNIDKDNK